MRNIKMVVFDLWWVLLKENDYVLDKIDQLLESKFGNINTDMEYYKRAEEVTGLQKQELEQRVIAIMDNIYELRDPHVFDLLPNMKFAIASNHLSLMNTWIDKQDIRPRFEFILLSWDCGLEKPNKEFYELLIQQSKENPENILFVDDNNENIQSAQNMWLSVLLFDRSKNLGTEIQSFLK